MTKDRMKDTHQNKAQNNRGTQEKQTSLPSEKKPVDKNQKAREQFFSR